MMMSLQTHPIRHCFRRRRTPDFATGSPMQSRAIAVMNKLTAYESMAIVMADGLFRAESMQRDV